MAQEPVSKQRIGWNLAHDVDCQAAAAAVRCVSHRLGRGVRAVAAAQPVALHQLNDALQLRLRAHEGQHQLDVAQAEHVSRARHGCAFQPERRLEAGRVVPAGASEAEHGVLLLRLIGVAAEQLAVLVGLEVGQAHDDRLRVESGRDGGDSFRDAAHVVLRRRRRAAAGECDALLEL